MCWAWLVICVINGRVHGEAMVATILPIQPMDRSLSVIETGCIGKGA